MSDNPLVTRSGFYFAFDAEYPDKFFTEYSSLVTPSEAKAEQFLLAIHGAYDSRSLFLNDLRIYLNYVDPTGGTRRSVDISAGIAKHYIHVLHSIFPTVDHFVGNAPYQSNLVAKLLSLITYFEDHIPEADRPDRAKAILTAIYERIPADGKSDALGAGHELQSLDQIHWFSLVHSEIPVTPVDLATLSDDAGNPLPDLNQLDDPLSITFSSGPLEMPPATRRTSQHFTRGAFSFDFSIVYTNPVSDDIDDILQQIAANRQGIAANLTQIQRLDRRLNATIKKVGELETRLHNLDLKYQEVQRAMNGITLRLDEVKNDLVENTSLVRGIADQISQI